MTTEEHDDAVRIAEGDHSNALALIRKCVPGKPGFGNEARYAETYQRLVLLGARPQLKLKYRAGR